MALGGGTFTAQNKVLPGTYVNVISRNSIRKVAWLPCQYVWTGDLMIRFLK